MRHMNEPGISREREINIAASQFSADREYWLKKLAGDLTVSHFPYDSGKSAANQREIHTMEFKLPPGLCAALIKAMNGADSRLHMILTAGLMTLLHKYTGDEDLILCTPIDKQNFAGKFINTVLVLRTFVTSPMTFRQVLQQVRQTIIEANQHQNYPIEKIPYDLDIAEEENSDFPLADIAILLENIKDKEYIRHINVNLLFSFSRENENIAGILEYNSSLFEKPTAERIISHYIQLLVSALANADSKVGDIDLLTAEEKKQVLSDFNRTDARYPQDKMIHQLFEIQVEKIPGNIALIEEDAQLTYLRLNEMVNGLAYLLRAKGVIANTIIGIMGKRSISMLIGILAILKSGGAYLPVNGIEPDERVKFILEDSHARLFLTQPHILEKNNSITQIIPQQNILLLDDLPGILNVTPSPGKNANPQIITRPKDTAYVIYTSGTTGRPKGVVIRHQGVVNYICWAARTYVGDEKVNFPFYTSISFDLTVTSIFTPLITGNSVIIYSGGDKEPLISEILDENKVEVVKITPSHLKLLMEKTIKRSNVKRFIVGGEVLETQLARRIHNNFNGNVEIFNEYGPTETSVGCMIYKFDPKKNKRESVPIGIPAHNVQVYILDKNQKPMPAGAVGEIYISGDGLAAGYLARPGLTADRFVPNPFIKDKIMYRTGDLARRLPDGNIEFLGRLDHQVKLRGFRIELAEIETKILEHYHIKEVITVAREDDKKGTSLCTYFIADRECTAAELKEYLSGKLPAYMIPTYFMQIDKIPLSTNGKVNTRALPEPELGRENEYIAPRNWLEDKLERMWTDVLGINRKNIGIDASFFELGGHSLSATIIQAKVRKELNMIMPLSEIFKSPTIRGLAEYLNEKKKDLFVSLEPEETKDFYSLSSAQKRLYSIQQRDHKSTAYNVSLTVTFDGILNRHQLENVFTRLIKRHESFRSTFIIINGEPVQRVYEHVEFQLGYDEVGEEEAGSIVENFRRPFDLNKAPLLRVGLVKTEETKHIMIVDMHHIITDGISMVVFYKDLLKLFSGEETEPLKLQYKDYSEWQKSESVRTMLKNQEEFWLDMFASPIPVLQLPADFPRPNVWTFEGNTLAFQIPAEDTQALKTMALEENVTMNILVLALFYLLLFKLTGQEDIVIGTPTAGRRHADLWNIMGVFINTIALRNYPSSEKTFNEFLYQVRERTIEAYDNQDYEFDELVKKAAGHSDTGRSPIFDVLFQFQNIDETREENLERVDCAGLTFTYSDYEIKSAKFDLYLYGEEKQETLIFKLEYYTRIFAEETINLFINIFKDIISTVIKNKDIKLDDIEVSYDLLKGESHIPGIEFAF
jgi:amino acid adenylation domain-containing protein